MDNEILINRFKMEFGTFKKVDKVVLIRRNYSLEEIETLVKVGILKPTKPYDIDGAFADRISFLKNH